AEGVSTRILLIRRTPPASSQNSTRVTPKLHQRHDTSRHAPQLGSLGQRAAQARTTFPTYKYPVSRGARVRNARVVLLQLCLCIRALTKGIFQYNNTLGFDVRLLKAMLPTYKRSLRRPNTTISTHHPIRAIRMYAVRSAGARLVRRLRLPS
ncbi:MAG: hypothetical protein ACK53Y_20905, partial [bacterium]